MYLFWMESYFNKASVPVVWQLSYQVCVWGGGEGRGGREGVSSCTKTQNKVTPDIWVVYIAVILMKSVVPQLGGGVA